MLISSTEITSTEEMTEDRAEVEMPEARADQLHLVTPTPRQQETISHQPPQHLLTLRAHAGGTASLVTRV